MCMNVPSLYSKQDLKPLRAHRAETRKWNPIVQILFTPKQPSPPQQSHSKTSKGLINVPTLDLTKMLCDLEMPSSLDICPHRAVLEGPRVKLSDQAKENLLLQTLKAQLGYVLMALLGEKRMTKYGFPEKSEVQILHMILVCTETQVRDFILLHSHSSVSLLVMRLIKETRTYFVRNDKCAGRVYLTSFS